MSKRVIWGCGTPNCDAGFRVHLYQTWVRLKCRSLGHKMTTSPMYHMEFPEGGGTVVTVTGHRTYCERCGAKGTTP